LFPIPWYVVLFVSIPEAFLVVVLGFSLFNLRISYKNALLVALIAAWVCYLVRLHNRINGIHTLIEALAIIVLCVLITRINTCKTTTAILAGLTIAGGLQYSYLSLIFSLTSTNINDLISRPWLNILLFIPQAVVMTLLYLWVRKTHFYILDGASRDA